MSRFHSDLPGLIKGTFFISPAALLLKRLRTFILYTAFLFLFFQYNLEKTRKRKKKVGWWQIEKGEQEKEDFQPPDEKRKVLRSVSMFC